MESAAAEENSTTSNIKKRVNPFHSIPLLSSLSYSILSASTNYQSKHKYDMGLSEFSTLSTLSGWGRKQDPTENETSDLST